MTTQQLDNLTMNIEQEIEVAAAPDATFRAIIQSMTQLGTGPDGQEIPMVLEEHPGGRWYRDLGNDAGHLWGHVQSIKPGELLEIYGPLFMSFAVANNLTIRIEAVGEGSRITLRHQFIGNVPEGYHDTTSTGWSRMLEGVKKALG